MFGADFGEAVWVDGEGVEDAHEEDRGRVVACEEEGLDRVGGCLEDGGRQGVGVLEGEREDGSVFGLAGCGALGRFDFGEAGLDGVPDYAVGLPGEENAADAVGDVGPVAHEASVGVGADEAFEAFHDVVREFGVGALGVEVYVHDDGADDVECHVCTEAFHLDCFSGFSDGIELRYENGGVLHDGWKECLEMLWRKARIESFAEVLP